ncbi:hypothetical protein QYF36_017131 [Acer negundo]|nr:hypothetical protein QYF36_017131 [Acer negundo]
MERTEGGFSSPPPLTEEIQPPPLTSPVDLFKSCILPLGCSRLEEAGTSSANLEDDGLPASFSNRRRTQ